MWKKLKDLSEIKLEKGNKWNERNFKKKKSGKIGKQSGTGEEETEGVKEETDGGVLRSNTGK